MKTYQFTLKCPGCGIFTHKTTTKNLVGKMCPTCGAYAARVRSAADDRQERIEHRVYSLDVAGERLMLIKLQEAQEEHAQAARALSESAQAAHKYTAIARHSGNGYAITEAARAADEVKSAQATEAQARARVETLRRACARFKTLIEAHI